MQAGEGIGPGGDALVPPAMTRRGARSQTAAAPAQPRPSRDPWPVARREPALVLEEREEDRELGSSDRVS